MMNRAAMVLALAATLVAISINAVPANAAPTRAPADAGTGNAVAAPTAWYLIQFRHSGQCLRTANGLLGSQLIQTLCDSRAWEQKWGIEWNPDGSGYAKFRNYWTQTCINVHGGSTANDARIIHWDCNANFGNDQWYGRPLASGGHHFFARHSGKCMVVQHAAMYTAARVIQYHCTEWDTPNDEITYIVVNPG